MLRFSEDLRKLQRLCRRPIWALLGLVIFVLTLDRTVADGNTVEQTTTPEPDAYPGCRAPDIRFTVIRPEATPPTEQPYAKFETTQIYLPEDFTTADVQFVQRAAKANAAANDGAIVNPYQYGAGVGAGAGDEQNDEDLHEVGDASYRQPLNGMNNGNNSNHHNRRDGKKRRSGNGRRRRIENENNGQGGSARGGSRYKRHAVKHQDSASDGKLAAVGDVYYVRIEDILKARGSEPKAALHLKLHKLRRKVKCTMNESQAGSERELEPEERLAKCKQLSERMLKKKRKNNARKDYHLKKIDSVPDTDTDADTDRDKEADVAVTPGSASMKLRPQPEPVALLHYRRRGDSHEQEAEEEHEDEEADKSARHGEIRVHWHRRHGDRDMTLARNETSPNNGVMGYGKLLAEPQLEEQQQQQQQEQPQSSAAVALQRVKRKSGKTTGALSRPKGGGDTSSKTTSRKDKGVFDEESAYSPVHPDETETEEEEEEEEEEEIDIQQQFTEVSEIRFPGEIGPLGDRRLCKIRCVKGKWVGPLCATNEEDVYGNVKFQPLYKSCHINRIPPHLQLSYRNISVNVGWDLPHGHSLQARCKDLGLHKLLGESRVLCSNGMWTPRMPSCVPTTMLTNFSDDSAPSIRIKVVNGSGAFEPSGVLAVPPLSTIHLDCMYPRVRGTPEWTWTSWYMQYPTGWFQEEKQLRYRLSIKNVQNNDSGTFTCTSPRGLTNSIAIVVATSICPRLPEPLMPLTLRLEGNKLGQRATYRCPAGYRIDGAMNSTCLASGSWSSVPPTCHPVQCPRLLLDDPHLSLIELNTSAWGRAIFKCQWGFKLTGPAGLSCEPTGAWSGPVPRCKAIQCPLPVAPLNGRIGGTNLSQRRITVGALITFSCNEGHTLVGEPSIICTENGFWSHSPPFCKSQCLYPGDPPNGLIAPLKFSYDAGDYLTVQCHPGYVQYSENGPPERPKCQPDGTWSLQVPKCRSYEEV